MARKGKTEEERPVAGPQRGDFIAPPEPDDADERADALPQQEEFWRPPKRFGSIPVEKEPLGWDRRRGFRKLFPQVMLPFQVVERVSFGRGSGTGESGTGVPPVIHGRDAHAASDHGQDAHAMWHNRLIWGDNLHVMRQLPSESIDLIYIDPPFFSGRNYNVIFGDRNELRSFSDIWEGGMPGYLVWLNARLYEMKRLLKKTGSIYVHCDYHASHYIKVELDKIFGHQNFVNEVVWCYELGGRVSKRAYGRRHDTMLFYAKSSDYVFNWDEVLIEWDEKGKAKFRHVDEKGRRYRLIGRFLKDSPIKGHRDVSPEWEETHPELVQRYYMKEGKAQVDFWTVSPINQVSKERIGYPTQKPEDLLERIITASSPQEGIVADFFTGGGTTAAVAQRLGRRWIACDQSRVAVAITADRLTRQVEEQTGRLFPAPDFTIEHWGVYEARRLADAPPEQFRAFVLRCFGAVPENGTGKSGTGKSGTGVSPVIHGQDAPATLKIRQGAYLPHWTKEGATYAVTFRLGDSLPQKVLEAWRAEREKIVRSAQGSGRPLTEHEEKRLKQLFSEKVEAHLDAGHGACWMKQDRIAEVVANALRHFDGERYDLLAWCVMPNHVHVVFRPRKGHDLPEILHSWKSFSAKEANKALSRSGVFWQEESYDHLIRDEDDFRHALTYVLDNPEKAGLKGWKWVGSKGVPPMKNHGQDARATIHVGGKGVPPMKNHGQDARATSRATSRATIHGYKGAIPVWVGEPKQSKAVTAADVQDFANAMRKTLRYKQDNLRDGIMLAWAFRPDAMEAAERLRKLERTDLNFIRLDMIRIDSPRFREHVTTLTTKHADYENFLTFVQPPKIEVNFKRIATRTYKFDVSETAILNPGARIINVQWDFDYGKRFSSTPGHSFVRGAKKEAALQAQFTFPADGKARIACKVQDDMGGEGLWTEEIDVN